jgi:hypothetical protein
MPYPSAYEAPPLDSAKRRALGTQYFKYGIPKATPLLGVPGATPTGGFQGVAPPIPNKFVITRND